jgi:hypothetical protein
MGTMQSANDEWIELFNTSEETIALDGWKLSAADETPTITLSGSIVGGGHFLLERTNDETMPNISADLIYVGALGNGGEELVLHTESGAEVTRVPASGGWPAGDNTTKQTMQWVNNSWVTADPTPKQDGTKPAIAEPEPTPAPVPELPKVPEVVIEQKIEEKPEVIITPVVQQTVVEKSVTEIPKQIPQTILQPATTTPTINITATSVPVITSIIQEVKPKEILPKKKAHKKKSESVELSAILNQEALAGGVYEIETPRSFWQNVLAIPNSIISFIKSFFT